MVQDVHGRHVNLSCDNLDCLLLHRILAERLNARVTQLAAAEQQALQQAAAARREAGQAAGEAAAAAQAAGQPCPRCGWRDGWQDGTEEAVVGDQQHAQQRRQWLQQSGSGHGSRQHDDEQLSLDLRVTTAQSAAAGPMRSSGRVSSAEAASQWCSADCGAAESGRHAPPVPGARPQELMSVTEQPACAAAGRPAPDASALTAGQLDQERAARLAAEAAAVAACRALERETARAAAAVQATEAGLAARLAALQAALRRMGSQSDLQHVRIASCFLLFAFCFLSWDPKSQSHCLDIRAMGCVDAIHLQAHSQPPAGYSCRRLQHWRQ